MDANIDLAVHTKVRVIKTSKNRVVLETEDGKRHSLRPDGVLDVSLDFTINTKGLL